MTDRTLPDNCVCDWWLYRAWQIMLGLPAAGGLLFSIIWALLGARLEGLIFGSFFLATLIASVVGAARTRHHLRLRRQHRVTGLAEFGIAHRPKYDQFRAVKYGLARCPACHQRFAALLHPATCPHCLQPREAEHA